MNSRASEASQARVENLCRWAKALLAHGLRGTDLVKCWIGWSIQPLSIRTRLFHQFTGETNDDMRYTEHIMNDDQLVKAAKKLLGENKTAIAKTGLAPFYVKNTPPVV